MVNIFFDIEYDEGNQIDTMARRSDHSRSELRRLALDKAAELTETEGLRGLRARQIVKAMGYTIGTLYVLFDDLDDLVLHMNGETLDRMHSTFSDVAVGGDVKQNLRAIGTRYIQFARESPNLWNAIFEHSLPNNRPKPDWYVKKVVALQELEERAIAPLLAANTPTGIKHHATVLWTSLYGMLSVEHAGALPAGESVEALVGSLIDNYVDGLALRIEQYPT